MSDSALSKQLTTLEQAGYVEIRKRFVGKRPRTSARLTAQGRAAFGQHVAAPQDRRRRARERAVLAWSQCRGPGVMPE